MTAERTTRAIWGMNTMPIASIAFGKLGPRTETTTMASRMLGKARMTSISRMSTEPGHQPDEGACCGRYCDGRQPGRQRDPGAVDHAREDVAAQLVLTERVCQARPVELLGEVLIQRVVGCHDRREDGHQDKYGHDGRPEDRQPVGEEGSEEVFPAAARLDLADGRCVLLHLRLGHLSTSPWGRGRRRVRPRAG